MVKKAGVEDLEIVTDLACQLWGTENRASIREEISALFTRPDAAFFLDWENGEAMGFAQCQLRSDYVEGTKTSPVGYLEGVFVRSPFRRQGVAARLVGACERWARENGCQEFASDCEVGNTESLAFHLSMQFREANRIICFVKPLEEDLDDE